MRLLVHAVFSREECQIMGTAGRSLTILYPEAELTDRGSRPPGLRAVNHLASGQAASHTILLRAEEALEQLLEVCTREANPEHWKRLAEQEEAELAARGHEAGEALAEGKVGLIAPGTDIGAVLAESRTQQMREAHRALRLVREAVRRVPPEPETEG